MLDKPSYDYVNEKVNEVDNKIGGLDTLETEEKGSVVDAVNELFTSVSNGKAKVASAITDKGVNTPQDATFDTMEANIRAIQTGSTGITPSGTKQITENGTHDVTNYASVEVNVQGSGTPTNGKVFTFTKEEKETISKWVTLVEADADVLAHKDDATLAVSFYNVSNPGAVTATTGGMALATPISYDGKYGITLRQTGAGAQSPSSLSAGLRSGTASAGVLYITDIGEVKIYQNGSYPLNVGTYIVTVSW